jgi:integrase
VASGHNRGHYMEHTAKTILALAPKPTRYEVPYRKAEKKGGGHALWIRVEPTGAKSYIARVRINGQSTKKRIAAVGEITLTEAVRYAGKLDDDARAGGQQHFTESKVLRQPGDTVRDAWGQYWDAEASKLASSGEKNCHWRLWIEPRWGDRALASIRKSDCAELIGDHLRVAPGKKVSTNHLFKTLRRFFAWCCGKGYYQTGLEASPMSGLEAPVDENEKRRPKRPLTEQELVWLFRAFEAYVAKDRHKSPKDKRSEVVRATELLLRSVCRRSDIYKAQWAWVSPRGLHIPKTKNSAPLLLPLTASMVALLGERPEEGGPVFTSKLDWLSHSFEDIREVMTEIAAKDGFNGSFRAKWLDADETEHNPYYVTLHNFRSTFITWATEQRNPDGRRKFSGDDREAMLNHRDFTTESKHYDAGADAEDWKLEDRKFIGAAWNAYLDGVKARA